MDEADVIIVGAGIAGLMAARRFKTAGVRATLLEAEASVGGRLATRQVGRGFADSGAQFFSVRSEEFRVETDLWQREGLIYQWSQGWSSGSLMENRPDGFPRYAARGGFGSLAISLGSGLDIVLSARLQAVEYSDGGWISSVSDGRQWRSRAILLTLPVPISLTLLERGAVGIKPGIQDAFAQIRYTPCLSGLFEIEGRIDLPAPGALQTPNAPISWIADNQRKGISPVTTTITVHAGGEASTKRWSMEDSEVLAWMAGKIRSRFVGEARIVAGRLDRWPYAVPDSCYPERFIVDKIPGPIAFAGDAFAGPRVEGAALSGMAAAEVLLALL